MKIEVRVIPNAKQNKIVKENGKLKVYLTSPAVEGRANKALVEIMSEFLKVRKNSINIVKGIKARNKIIEIT